MTHALRRQLPPAHRAAEAKAQALVLDPHAALAAGATRRRLAWSVLLSARGCTTRQWQLLIDARRRGLAP